MHILSFHLYRTIENARWAIGKADEWDVGTGRELEECGEGGKQEL